MKIQDIEAQQGEKAFGKLEAVRTRGRFSAHIPLHIIEGDSDGPTFLVHSGISGLEIEPAMTLPKVVDQVDPSRLSGTLLVAPLINTSGFEFEQRNAIWDDSDLNTLGRGCEDGTVSEQLINTYYKEVVSSADALVEIHTGELWGYFNYSGVYEDGNTQSSTELASSLGLPQVLVGQPEDKSMACHAAGEGKSVVSAWIGGGPGLRDFREENAQRIKNVVFNGLKHLGMYPGDLESETDTVEVLEANTVMKVNGERGLTLMDKSKRGKPVEKGEQLGKVKHPFSGEITEKITAPREGVMVDAGASWPSLPEYATVAMLGNKVDEVDIG